MFSLAEEEARSQRSAAARRDPRLMPVPFQPAVARHWPHASAALRFAQRAPQAGNAAARYGRLGCQLQPHHALLRGAGAEALKLRLDCEGVRGAGAAAMLGRAAGRDRRARHQRHAQHPGGGVPGGGERRVLRSADRQQRVPPRRRRTGPAGARPALLLQPALRLVLGGGGGEGRGGRRRRGGGAVAVRG
jgi:hypothetical protein